ncbi:MAG: citrate lyase ACP [Planctomycetota bacterium]|nr:MAG: citrate lyase ACP [Planctomycetota bacterium]
MSGSGSNWRAAEAGRRGAEVRGDLWLGWEPGGAEVRVELHSRLASLYGDATRRLLESLLAAADAPSGVLRVEDQGAYPFLIRARFESLVRKASGDPSFRVEPEPPLGPPPGPPRRDRPRRSRLYLPGNEAKYMLNAALHRPDGVILDLEDSVAPAAKEDARALVRHALHTLDWGGCERMVRINQGEAGLADLAALADAPFHLLLIPKVESAEEVRALDQAVGERELLFMPILETARGVMNAMEIAAASPRNVALTLGLEDLTADLGVAKTAEGEETRWACSRVILAAKAHGLQAIDSVYGDVADEAGLRASLRRAKAMGFEGKGCVHPRQIRVVHEELAPSAAEIERARRIVAAWEEARARGEGVVALGAKMIDPPVVKRALALVRRLEEAGAAD